MSAWEMIDGGVVFCKHRFVVGDGVIFAEESPYPVAPFRPTAVKLGLHQSGKLFYQRFVNAHFLMTVLAWRLVGLQTDAVLQKTGHVEVWVTQQGRDAGFLGNDLSQKGAATIAYEQVGLFFLAVCAHLLEGFFRMQGKIRCINFCNGLREFGIIKHL